MDRLLEAQVVECTTCESPRRIGKGEKAYTAPKKKDGGRWEGKGAVPP
jgi:hypothetical protein